MDSLSSERKTKASSFHKEWEIPYLLRSHGGISQCVVCKKHLICKLFNIKRHYDTLHAAEYAKYEGGERTSIYKSLIELLEAKEKEVRNMRLALDIDGDKVELICIFYEIVKEVQPDNAGLVRASFEISLELARSSHSFSDGEFIKTCILKSVKILSNDELPKYEALSLSRRTVSRRVTEMAEDVERQLKERIKEFVAFSLAIDESTDVADIAQLAIFIRGVDKYLNVTEELLDIIPMKGTTRAEDIFSCVENCGIRMALPWAKLCCVATDGAKAMTGSKIGLIARLRNKLKDESLTKEFVAVHCLIHQEALCSKAVRLKNVMEVVVKCTNIIRAHGLTHRQFKDFMESIASQYKEIPYYSEIRWLSCGTTLKRFFELRSYICEFLKQKNKPFLELEDPEWVADLAFLTDITQHLNTLCSAIIGREKLICQMSDEIVGFQRKLFVWKQQLMEKNFHFFPCLQTLPEIQVLDVTKFCTVIGELQEQFRQRFLELEPLRENFEIFVAPFTSDVLNAPVNLQMELIDLQCNTRLKHDYKDTLNIVDFYKCLPSDNFPVLRKFAADIIAMFGSTYSCEQFFSLMKINKSRFRSRLSDTSLGSVMRLGSARGIEPDITALVSDKRCQSSHH